MIMQILVLANELQREEWLQHNADKGVAVEFTGKADGSFFERLADVYFLLDYKEWENQNGSLKTHKPVFVNALVKTLQEFPANAIRINAWPRFLGRSILEVVASEENKPVVEEVMQALGRQYQLVPDVPGMIAARTVSMIINEAYYTLEEEISSAEEIDIAMKLGTNYPYGPFEWARQIGIEKILYLLEALSLEGARYAVAPALKKAAEQLLAFKNTIK